MSYTPDCDFPLIWDDTMRRTLFECPWKCRTEFFHHYKPGLPNINLHAGKAWAAAMESTRLAYYRDLTDPEVAEARGLETLIREYGDFDCPPTSNKTLSRMMEAFAFYHQTYPLDDDQVRPYIGKNGPMVEFSFALPLDDRVRHPVTNEPIIYVGRADMVATYAGALSIYDDKTTTQLGASWPKQWMRRSQFSGYCWAAQESNLPARQVIVRGISILKEKFGAAQVVTVRTPAHIAEWHEQCVRDILRAIESWKTGIWDKSLGEACAGFGGCMFLQPCGAIEPEPWLQSQFVRRVWNPASREEHILTIPGA